MLAATDYATWLSHLIQWDFMSLIITGRCGPRQLDFKSMMTRYDQFLEITLPNKRYQIALAIRIGSTDELSNGGDDLDGGDHNMYKALPEHLKPSFLLLPIARLCNI